MAAPLPLLFASAALSKGVVLSVGASVLFAVLYFYSTLLHPLDSTEIFGWRMLLTFPCLTGFLLYAGDWCTVRKLWDRIDRHRRLTVGLVATSTLLGTQIWLFMWAPLHGRGLQVSMGYFLLPLTMIVAGRLVYGERLGRLRTVAAGCALLGVAHALYQAGSFSWESLAVAVGYPAYFMLRRRLALDGLAALWFEMGLMVPASLYFVLANGMPLPVFEAQPRLYALVPVLGMISAAALGCYVLASRSLPFGLFGLLGYVEPVLLLAVALMLGETIGADDWLTYGPIWVAVGLLVVEGARHVLLRGTASEPD